ncbi:MAG: alpha-amylase family glycosyl hydrolase, partial [Actinomycetota bacterium]
GLVKEDIFKDHRDPEGLTRALRLDVSDMDRVERESLLADVPFFDKEGVHEIYRSWRKILDSYAGQKMSVAEAWVHPSSRAMRYVRSDELHQIFNFDFLIAPWDSEFLVSAINKTLSEVGQVGASPTWVLSNHDSPRLVTRLGGGQLGRQRARAMALLTHGLPGGIYIYQGEELGLEDGNLEDKDRQDPVFFRTKGVDKGRDGARIPIPWSSQLPNYGFTTRKPWLPIPSTWQEHCVEAQVDEDSHLTLYRKSLHMRKLLSRQIAPSTEITWIDTPKGVLAFSRGDDFFLYANTTGQSFELKLESESQIILSSSAQAQLKSDTLTLPAESTVWLGKITK